MVPDVMVLCVIVAFGISVAQRVHHVTSHDSGSLLRSIYERTGLLLDIAILGLQAFCKPRRPSAELLTCYSLFDCLMAFHQLILPTRLYNAKLDLCLASGLSY